MENEEHGLCRKDERTLLRKKYGELKKLCEHRLSLEPNDMDALFYYATVLEVTGDFEGAEKKFEKLYNITKDRMFLVCEALPEFMQGKRKEAAAKLRKVTEEEGDCNKVFYVFKMAVQNGEINIGREALLKCLKIDSDKTRQNLSEFFASLKPKSMEERKFLVNLIILLNDVQQLKKMKK
ncbi:MAG: hypothetical protein GY852_04185 [bacterium]|nr:hypothetical protein [bacterium]